MTASSREVVVTISASRMLRFALIWNYILNDEVWGNTLAPQVGFEPTTDRLTADCSTTELLRSIRAGTVSGHGLNIDFHHNT